MPSATDKALEVCTLRPGPWPAVPATCVWCGEPLTGRRRRWCSDACSWTFTEQHSWPAAREAAKRRDDHRCVRCGSDGLFREGEEFLALLRIFCPRAEFPHMWEWAEARGYDMKAEYREAMGQWQIARHAVFRPWGAAHDLHAKECRRRRIEVNHKVPILGRHAEFSCIHHVDNVECLCHECHLAETARQFGHRPRVPQPALFE